MKNNFLAETAIYVDSEQKNHFIRVYFPRIAPVQSDSGAIKSNLNGLLEINEPRCMYFT